MNGITAFYPNELWNDSQITAPLLVAQYQKLDTETGQLVSHLTEYRAQKEVHLSPSDRLFKLSFGLLDYRYLGQTRLWYRIHNWQEKWVVHEGDNLSFNGLPAGSYTLEVRAQTSNGVWASSVLSVPITVDKPVYLRGWFLLLCFLLLGGLVMAVFRWRNKQLRADKLRLEVEVARRTAQIEHDKAVIEQDKAIIERQALDLQKNAVLKSRFFANVTHEFKTPLTLLLGPLQYLSGHQMDSVTRDLVTMMDRNARQLLTLVNDLLDLSRLDSHELKLHEQPVDVQLVVNRVMMNFITQAHYTGIELSVSGNERPLLMQLDIQKFETALRNLVANALRFTPPGGFVKVCLSCTEGHLQVVVEDTGGGISAEDMPHIFERYFQSNQADKPLQGGTGIGLALCMEYCQLWGGTLMVDSQVGQGSRFTMTYPVRSFEEAVPPAPLAQPIAFPDQRPTTEKEKAPPPSTDLTILLVDDNADMLRYAKVILAPYYSLQFASNGRQALDTLKALPKEQLPDLIISDIMMPEVDGLVLVESLQTNPLLRDIPIILLTARTELESRLQALRLGVTDYLTKPFYEAELLTRIQNLLRRREEKASWLPEETVDTGKETTGESVEWIKWLEQTIRQNLNNQFFNAKMLADMANMSERQLNRRLRALTGFTPGQFIQEIRLQVAYDLIEKNPDLLVKVIAVQVGYQKVAYFSQLYSERFGVNPKTRSQLLIEAEK